MKLVVVLITLIAIAVMAYAFYPRGPELPKPGDGFANEAAFIKPFAAQGYVQMGKFSPDWPAVVVDVQHSEDASSFSINGQSNVYQGPAYAGYGFLFYRLVSTKKKTEFGFLFKTQNKIK